MTVEQAHAAFVADIDRPVRAILGLGVPLLVLQTYLMTRSVTPQHVWIHTILATMMILSTVVVIAVVVRRPMRPSEITATLAVVVLTLAWGIDQVGVAGLDTRENWFVGGVVAPLTILCATLPWRWQLASIVTPTAVVIASIAFSEQSITMGGVISSILGAVLGPTATTGLGVVVRRGNAALERERMRVVRASAAEKAYALQAEARRRYLERTEADVVPFLEAIAVDPPHGRVVDDEAREIARLLEAMTRDDLLLGDLLTDTGRDAVWRARARGVEVTLRASLADASYDELEMLLVAVLEEAASGRPPRLEKVTVGPAADDARVLRFALIPPLDATSTQTLLTRFRPRLEAESDELLTVLRSDREAAP